LEGIDRKLEKSNCTHLLQLQKELWKQYERSLLQEEAVWYQRARNDWLQLGERNTHFFHASVIAKNKNKNITYLLDDASR